MPEVVKSALLKVPASDIFALLVQAERNVEWGAAPGLQRASDPRANGRGHALSLWFGVHGNGD